MEKLSSKNNNSNEIIISSDNKSDLIISMTGPMTKNYLDLNTLGIALINIQSIFDKTYCYYSNHAKVCSSDRDNFKIIATDVKKGSIIFYAGIVLFTIQQALPLSSFIELTPDLIKDITFKAFDLLINIISKTKANNPPQIIIKNSPNCQIVYSPDGNQISVSKDIATIAQKMRTPLKNISKTFNKNTKGEFRIEDIDSKSKPIVINNENAELFKNNTVISNIPLSIEGVVKSYSKETYSGQFKVISSNSIPIDKYSFTVDKKYQDDDLIFIESLKGTKIRVIAYPEYDTFHITSNTKIIRLYLSPVIEQ